MSPPKADWERPCSRCGLYPPEAEFGLSAARNGKRYRRSWCVDCSRRSRQEWGARNAHLISQINLEQRLRRVYGLSHSEYLEMIAACENCCQICGKAGTAKALHVDHDHGTGKVRGLLCENCNRGLGMFQDNPQSLAKAITYLLEAEADNLTETNTSVNLPRG